MEARIPLKVSDERKAALLKLPQESIRLESESDEFRVVSVVGVMPRRRDFWRVLWGTYRPLVVRRSAVTLAGVSKTLKEVWTGDKLSAQFYSDNPLFESLEGDDAS
jgi:hypothetical protein